MNFRQQVYNFVKKVPFGKVVTYGQVATQLGAPRNARQVGYALRALGLNEENIPWWRVVNKVGHISINHGEGGVEKQIQKTLLEAEGINVGEDMNIEIRKYLWKSF